MKSDESSIPVESFANWVPAQDAFIELRRHFQSGNQAWSVLNRHLTTGIMMGAASVVVRHADGQKILRHWISRERWKEIGGEQSILWSTGECDFDRRGYDRFSELQDSELISYIGIRLERGGLNAIAPLFGDPLVDAVSATASKPSGADAPPLRKQDLPKLPEPIARAWAEWFKGIPGNVTQQAAEKSASLMFPNHNLSRDRIRDLIEPAKQGRRKETKP